MPFAATRTMRFGFGRIDPAMRIPQWTPDAIRSMDVQLSPPSTVFQTPPLGVVTRYTPGSPATPCTDATGPPSNGPVHRQVRSAYSAGATR